jgi:hypothetical protein
LSQKEVSAYLATLHLLAQQKSANDVMVSNAALAKNAQVRPYSLSPRPFLAAGMNRPQIAPDARQSGLATVDPVLLDEEKPDKEMATVGYQWRANEGVLGAQKVEGEFSNLVLQLGDSLKVAS